LVFTKKSEKLDFWLKIAIKGLVSTLKVKRGYL